MMVLFFLLVVFFFLFFLAEDVGWFVVGGFVVGFDDDVHFGFDDGGVEGIDGVVVVFLVDGGEDGVLPVVGGPAAFQFELGDVRGRREQEVRAVDVDFEDRGEVDVAVGGEVVEGDGLELGGVLGRDAADLAGVADELRDFALEVVPDELVPRQDQLDVKGVLESRRGGVVVPDEAADARPQGRRREPRRHLLRGLHFGRPDDVVEVERVLELLEVLGRRRHPQRRLLFFLVDIDDDDASRGVVLVGDEATQGEAEGPLDDVVDGAFRGVGRGEGRLHEGRRPLLRGGVPVVVFRGGGLFVGPELPFGLLFGAAEGLEVDVRRVGLHREEPDPGRLVVGVFLALLDVVVGVARHRRDAVRREVVLVAVAAMAAAVASVAAVGQLEEFLGREGEVLEAGLRDFVVPGRVEDAEDDGGRRGVEGVRGRIGAQDEGGDVAADAGVDEEDVDLAGAVEGPVEEAEGGLDEEEAAEGEFDVADH
mmetsp:Transcript_13208/g.43048  ORF Transcript_13208/g.43048 Transcript_13208/m.43048 type:complete len:479 (+) Transcript_13208:290-1726(+)